MNLLGKVQILDEDSALRYLQFFSSPDTYQLFQLDGMLDLNLLRSSAASRLRRTLREQGEIDQPRVTSTTANSFCVTSSATLTPCTRSTFIVSRLALFYDGNVYRLTEELHEDGSYDLTSKALVLRNVAQFGVTHEPPALDPGNGREDSGPTQAEPEAEDSDRQLFCLDSGSLCLAALRQECSLVLVEGESIPPQAEQRVVLVSDGVRRTVRGPEDLTGCVSIDHPEHALEYLRFFSSWATAHLFDQQLLEVSRGDRPAYLHGPEGTCFICLPPARWEALSLAPPRVEATRDGFLVTRYAVRPAPEDANASDLYRVVQFVGRDGAVKILSQDPVPGLDPGERYGLAFPRYL